MRPLVSRGLLLPPLVCAALILGPVGTAAAADAGRGGSDHGVAHLATWYGTDDADALVDRLDALDRAEHGSVLQPLLDAVTDVAALDDTGLDADVAAAHAKAVEEANAKVQEQLRQLAGTDRSAAAADPVSDLLASLQSTVDNLLKALTSLDLGGVLSAVTGLLGTVVGAVTGLLGGGLPSLPALPQLPALPSLPATG
ncbi:hypothetical protein [Streptomyces sp. SID13726]|uniref:hypothetical protein n=1 Tax=Streptomyces sp. SID13726 TaxID=2706058 RepID=UPI0013B7A431|nr:hypothetical protein [Streptomyces sp. SID13726]NEA98194.1 hypothetical protein [Streptomyces sp. SID13726]